MHILRAYCVEIGRVVNIDEARQAFLALNPRPKKLNFLCSTPACRKKSVRVTGVNYWFSAETGKKHVAAHFRECDEHIPGCEWLADIPAVGSSRPGKLDGGGNKRRRQARLKETDYVTVFDARCGVGPSVSGTIGTGGGRGGLDGPGEGQKHAPPADKKSRTTTNQLERLVESYLEIKAREGLDGLRKRRFSVVGLGDVSWFEYFRPVKYASLNMDTSSCVLCGGAKWHYRDGNSHRFEFYDEVDGQAVQLTVSCQTLTAYRSRRRLQDVLNSKPVPGYFNVYAQGRLERPNKFADVIELVVDHLDSLVLRRPLPSRLTTL